MLQVSQVTRATYPHLCAALAPEPETLAEHLSRKGIKDPVIRSAKWHHAQVLKQSPGAYRFPSDSNFQHQMLIERQSPLFTFNVPDCIGDEQQFSSPGLTDWYVRNFCALNNLTSGA